MDADIANFAPFSDSKMRTQQRLVAKAAFQAFNQVALTLLETIARLHPTDVTLRTIRAELDKAVGKDKRTRVPALTFFREVRKDVTQPDGTTCPYIDLLVARDDRAFADPIPVGVLNGIGLGAKWSDLSADCRAQIWEYVQRLVDLSVKAVFNGTAPPGEANKLSQAILVAAVKGKADGSLAGVANAEQALRRLAQDEGVRSAASSFVAAVK